MVEAGNGGIIINITSIMTERTTATTVPYCASKGGARTLTKAMAVALAPYNIRVNAISPCIIWTDMSDALLSKTEVRDTIRSKIPLNRIAKSEVLVGAAIYLASDESSYVTGSTVSVDGGMSAM
jgi:NAD(P)-dependent dehydrogenase (short-subunit alcohol dehydrogenase family)